MLPDMDELVVAGLVCGVVAALGGVVGGVLGGFTGALLGAAGAVALVTIAAHVAQWMEDRR